MSLATYCFIHRRNELIKELFASGNDSQLCGVYFEVKFPWEDREDKRRFSFFHAVKKKARLSFS
jgi:hypothetical protein